MIPERVKTLLESVRDHSEHCEQFKVPLEGYEIRTEAEGEQKSERLGLPQSVQSLNGSVAESRELIMGVALPALHGDF